jgi:hypothetical protein
MSRVTINDSDNNELLTESNPGHVALAALPGSIDGPGAPIITAIAASPDGSMHNL